MEIHYLDRAKCSIDKTLKQVPYYLNINVVHVCMEIDYLEGQNASNGARVLSRNCGTTMQMVENCF